MNIGIVGFGRMGREVEAQALSRGHSISCIIDRTDPRATCDDLSQLNAETIRTTDIFIEFALPDSIEQTAAFYAKAKTPAVIGTTGWDDVLERVHGKLISAFIPCMYGANFSVGAHVFARLAEQAAAMINTLQHYDASLYEWHHAQKKDRPSGTALMTARLVLAKLDRKTRIESDVPLDAAADPRALYVVSQRAGFERGFHELTLDSDADTIKISHSARSRAGFALGAVLAAEWLRALQQKRGVKPGQKYGGLIPVEEFIDSLLAGGMPAAPKKKSAQKSAAR